MYHTPLRSAPVSRFFNVAAMSFRSLLEAAMGDAQELPQDEVGRIDAQMEMMDEEDQQSDGNWALNRSANRLLGG